LWGRYEFLPADRWSPFAALGAGAYFDEVNTQFQGANDRRTGRRDFLGIGGGLTVTFRERLLVEGEARAASIEESDQPVVSFLLRVGVQL
jgi:hypothetical protein